MREGTCAAYHYQKPPPCSHLSVLTPRNAERTGHEYAVSRAQAVRNEARRQAANARVRGAQKPGRSPHPIPGQETPRLQANGGT